MLGLSVCCDESARLACIDATTDRKSPQLLPTQIRWSNGLFRTKVLAAFTRVPTLAARSLDTSGELFAQHTNVWLAEQIKVIKIDIVNFHTTRCPGSTSHLRIFDIVERLFRILEQDHRCAEAGGNVVARPKDLLPIRPS